MGAAPGRAKTCKIMQIAFVRTSSTHPLTPVLPLLPAAPSPARRLPSIPSSRLSLSLSRVRFLFLWTTLSSLYFSSFLRFFSSSPHFILRALLRFAASTPPLYSLLSSKLSVDPARGRASVKNVSTIVCRGVCSFIFAEGVEYQAGRGCRCHRRAPGDETSPAIFTSLCRTSGKRKKVREIARSRRPRLGSPSDDGSIPRLSDNG